MVTDQQVRRLFKLMQTEITCVVAADKTGMDEKTARKYVHAGKLPSELRQERTWRTRADPFEQAWAELREMLAASPGLEAKTLFEDLQVRFPGRFSDGQLRTLQRRVKRWRALEGPSKETFFPQLHRSGELAQSDYTHMGKLGITISHQPFDHLIYHFVLTYSNWETCSILRKPQRRAADRIVGTRWRAACPPDRPVDGGSAQRPACRGIHAALPGPAQALRAHRTQESGCKSQRERRRGAA